MSFLICNKESYRKMNVDDDGGGGQKRGEGRKNQFCIHKFQASEEVYIRLRNKWRVYVVVKRTTSHYSLISNEKVIFIMK
jgi:hypothetical protein